MRTGNMRIRWRPEVTPYASLRKWRAPFFRSLNHVQAHSIHTAWESYDGTNRNF